MEHIILYCKMKLLYMILPKKLLNLHMQHLKIYLNQDLPGKLSKHMLDLQILLSHGGIGVTLKVLMLIQRE